MGNNPENMIKKAISEMIAEEMFKEFGYYVMKSGQEHLINPITQLTDFIGECGGRFRLKYNMPDEYSEITYLQKLPDFTIVDKKGEVSFLEVKFSKSGKINEDKIRVLDLYPQTNILIVNTEVGESLAYINKGSKSAVITPDSVSENLKESRFHICQRVPDDKESGTFNMEREGIEANITPLLEWIVAYLDLKDNEIEKYASIIYKYEQLVEKWLTEKTV